MNLGKTLVGGVLGAAAGVAVQVGLEVFLKVEATWVPVVIGLFTGLGVRQLDPSAAQGVSYARGALSGVLALSAIVLGPNLVAQMRSKQDVVQQNPLPRAAAPAQIDGAQGPAREGDLLDEAPPMPVPLSGSAPELGPQNLVKRPDQFSTWQFIFMAVGMLLAYEFARGTEVRYPSEKEADPPEGPGKQPVAAPPVAPAAQSPATQTHDDGGDAHDESAH